MTFIIISEHLIGAVAYPIHFAGEERNDEKGEEGYLEGVGCVTAFAIECTYSRLHDVGMLWLGGRDRREDVL